MAANDADPPAVAKHFIGTLHGGVVAIGAETTGWVLESDELGRIDVDASKVADAAAGLDGQRVRIDGTLTSVNWPERGERRLLLADTIRAVDQDDDER